MMLQNSIFDFFVGFCLLRDSIYRLEIETHKLGLWWLRWQNRNCMFDRKYCKNIHLMPKKKRDDLFRSNVLHILFTKFMVLYNQGCTISSWLKYRALKLITNSIRSEIVDCWICCVLNFCWLKIFVDCCFCWLLFIIHFCSENNCWLMNLNLIIFLRTHFLVSLNVTAMSK